MIFSYISCWLLGICTMFCAMLAEHIAQPFRFLFVLGVFILGLLLVIMIMRNDGGEHD